MPQLKPLSSHKLCSAYIQRYLEKEERALARDFFNVPEEHRERWAEWFDAIRERVGNDLPWRGKDAVTYQHFVISPDPRDQVDLETLQSLVCDWYAENFLSEDGVGPYPTAVVYHDDNEGQIVHAHVIVNNTIPGLERNRLQFSNARNKAMGDSLQRLAFAYGLSHFPNFDRPPDEGELAGRAMPDFRVGPRVLGPVEGMKRAKRLTRAESGMLERGVIPWKEKMRNAIDVAVGRSVTQEEMDASLLLMGVIREDRGEADDIYYMQSRPSLRVRGRTLGDDYAKDMLRSRLAMTRMDWDAAGDDGRRLAQKAQVVMSDHDTLWWFYVNSEGVAEDYLESGVTAREIAETERVNNLFHITSPDGYDEAVAQLKARSERLEERGRHFEASQLLDQISDVESAREVARLIDLFGGVDAPAAKRTFADIDRELSEMLAATGEDDIEARLRISKDINDNRERWARAREKAKQRRGASAARARAVQDGPDTRARRVAQGR